MKRFFLYFLLILFIAGLAMLAYGFWNAKNIRLWAVAVGEIKAQYDIEKNENNIVGNLNALGGKKSEELRDALNSFRSNLDSISNEMRLARASIEKMNTPRAARSLKSEMIDYYSQGGQQAGDLASYVEFWSRVFDATIVFDGMTADTTTEERNGMIAEAKAKSKEIDAEALPAELKDSGIELKTATYDYLDAFDQYASGKVDSHDQLDESYADFSQKQNDFWEEKKNLAIYANARKMDVLESKIDNDLLVLERIRFSIK